nr:hypothetical protein [Tanacetum cinerariifolium]
MIEYIRHKEEKAQKRGKVFNWKTTKYDKIWYDEDVHNLRSVETEFPAIVFNDNLTSNETLSCEPTIDEFDLKDETSLFEYDEVEQNKFGLQERIRRIRLTPIRHMALPPCDQRQLRLRYQVEGYIEEIVHDFEQRLGSIFRRHIRLIDSEMGLDVADTLCFQLGGARRSMTWRQFILALGLHIGKEMVEDRFSANCLGSARMIPDKGDLNDY